MDLQIKKNPDFIVYREIAKAIEKNDGYCCCAVEHTPDTKCMCKDFMASDKVDFCHCGRFYKVHQYGIITLCGSTKFKDDFYRMQKELTLAGWIVLMPGVFGHAGDQEVLVGSVKETLDDMHKSKIEMSDAIYVINKDNYIGTSTQSEIEWAKNLGKDIFYMEEQL